MTMRMKTQSEVLEDYPGLSLNSWHHCIMLGNAIMGASNFEDTTMALVLNEAFGHNSATKQPQGYWTSVYYYLRSQMFNDRFTIDDVQRYREHLKDMFIQDGPRIPADADGDEEDDY